MPKPYVSDHAVLRYAERAMGLDVAQIRRLIGDAVSSADGLYPLPVTDCLARVFNGCVVTVAPTSRSIIKSKPKLPKALRPMADAFVDAP